MKTCPNCGGEADGRYPSHGCAKCYMKWYHAHRKEISTKVCAICGIKLHPDSKGDKCIKHSQIGNPHRVKGNMKKNAVQAKTLFMDFEKGVCHARGCDDLAWKDDYCKMCHDIYVNQPKAKVIISGRIYL